MQTTKYFIKQATKLFNLVSAGEIDAQKNKFTLPNMNTTSTQQSNKAALLSMTNRIGLHKGHVALHYKCYQCYLMLRLQLFLFAS